MFKSKWFAVVAALALLVLVAGCASQAGSEPSTVEPQAEAVATIAPSVSESPLPAPEVGATDEITATGEVTATEPATGATPAETEATAGSGAGSEMPALSATAQGWPLMWDPEIGFEVRYPQGWLVGEAEVSEQDAPVTRVYTFAPADWAEDYSPVLVEVSEGSEADFRRMYIEPAETEERNIGPLTYRYETSGAEGSMENYAVFTSPDNPDVRVVIRDVVTGFPERAGAHADFGTLIGEIVESFRWRK